MTTSVFFFAFFCSIPNAYRSTRYFRFQFSCLFLFLWSFFGFNNGVNNICDIRLPVKCCVFTIYFRSNYKNFGCQRWACIVILVFLLLVNRLNEFLNNARPCTDKMSHKKNGKFVPEVLVARLCFWIEKKLFLPLNEFYSRVRVFVVFIVIYFFPPVSLFLTIVRKKCCYCLQSSVFPAKFYSVRLVAYMPPFIRMLYRAYTVSTNCVKSTERN